MMSAITTDVDKLNVTKANKLIQITLMESKTRLSLKDQKIILAVIAQINPEDEDFKDYSISINDVIKITGMKRQNIHIGIEDSCTKLMTSPITIKETNNPKGFLIVNWFSHAEYLPSKGCINFSVSPRLKPYLLQLKGQFTSYRLKQVMSLQSSYSIRMYELLRQFLPINAVDKGTQVAYREITIEDLRGYLGVEDGKYPRFADFKNKVIVKIKQEIKSETDLSFDFEPIRKGRKIGALKFTIRHDQKFTALEKSPVISSDNLIPMNEGVALLLKTNIPDMTDMELLAISSMYEEDVIRDSTLDFIAAIMSKDDIKKTHNKYFNGILKAKAKEYSMSKENKSLKDKLTDRSWDC